MWLTLNPEKIAEFIPTAITKRAIAGVWCSSSMKPRKTRAIAGTTRPMELKIFLVVPMEAYFLMMRKSAMALKMKLKTQRTKYGRALR